VPTSHQYLKKVIHRVLLTTVLLHLRALCKIMEVVVVVVVVVAVVVIVVVGRCGVVGSTLAVGSTIKLFVT